MKLSIIVPVYNVEKYIGECIESLCKQSIDDFEIIVVNDGSQDRSIDIVKSFKDKRINIINKENGGLSSARNTGLSIAKGEYIAFVDSDDFIDNKDAYKDMYNIAKINNSEIIVGNCKWYFSKDKYYSLEWKLDEFIRKNEKMEAEQYFLACMRTKRTYAPVCFNIYKRTFLLDNKLFFKEGVYHEDEEFTPRVLLKANSVSIYDKDFYVYRQREGSITNSILNPKRGYDLLEIYLSLENIFPEIKSKELKLEFKKYLIYLAIEQIYKYKFKDVSSELKRSIMNNSISKGQKVRALLININIKYFFIFENIFRKLKKNQCKGVDYA